MAKKQMNLSFEGFSPQCFDFLLQLSFNNDKAWFAEHREEYKTFVQTPMLALEREWAPSMLAIDPLVRTGRYALSRIHRDTRFSKDKSPYRDNAWIAYRPANTMLSDYFGIFFEITPVSYIYGMGLYAPHPAFMEAFRKKTLANPAALQRLMNDSELTRSYTLQGESYVRPKVTDAPAELLPILNMRSFHFYRESSDLSKTQSRLLLTELEEALKVMREFYLFANHPA